MLNKILQAIAAILTVFIAGAKNGKKKEVLELQKQTIELLTENDKINKQASNINFTDGSELLLKKRRNRTKK